MLASQARRSRRVLVDRHVLSRDDLEIAIGESSRTGDPLPAVLLTRRARRREGPDRRHRRDRSACASSTSRARRSTPTRRRSIPETGRRERARDRRRLRGHAARRRVRRPGRRRGGRSAVGAATGYEIIRRGRGSRTSSCSAIDIGLRRRDRTGAPAGGDADARRRRRVHERRAARQRPARAGARPGRLRPPPHRGHRRRSSACTAS